MNINPETFPTEISDTLATTGEDYTTTTANLGDYGTSTKITKHGSNRTLYLTPIETDTIDTVLYDENGNTIATFTLFNKTVTHLTAKTLANLITACF